MAVYSQLPAGFVIEEPQDYFPDPTRFSGGVMTSGRRTPEGNALVGGVSRSNHLTGSAADYTPLPGQTLQDTLAAAQGYFGDRGRAGIHGDHVHVDFPGYQGVPYFGDRGVRGVERPLPAGFQIEPTLTNPDLLSGQRRSSWTGPPILPGGPSLSVSGAGQVGVGKAIGGQLIPPADPRFDNSRRLEPESFLPSPPPPPPAPRPGPIVNITTRNDPRLEGVNRRFAEMYASGAPEQDITEYLAGYGITPDQIPAWRQAFAFRNRPEFARWRNMRPDLRPPMTVNLDDISLPESQQRTAVALPPPGPSPQEIERWNRDRIDIMNGDARISRYEPNWGEQAGGAVQSALEPVLGRHSAQEAGRNVQGILGYGDRENLLSPIPPLEWASEAYENRQRALSEGRLGEAARYEGEAAVYTLMAIPIFGRAKNASTLAGRALDEIEQVATREGVDLAGRGVDEDLAAAMRRNWQSLSPETRELIGSLSVGREGPRPAIGALVHDLRRAATAPPSLWQRATSRVRAAMGGARRGDEAAPLADEAAGAQGADAVDMVVGSGRVPPGGPAPRQRDVIDINNPPPPGFVIEEASRGLASSNAPAVRRRDIIDVNALPGGVPLRQSGAAIEPPATVGGMFGRGATRRIGDMPPPDALAAGARSVRAENLLPRPANRVDSLDEARTANPGTIREVSAPSPESMLRMGTYRHPVSGRDVRFRGPLDAVAYLRNRGGLNPAGLAAELRMAGIVNNAGRQGMRGEQRLGPIMNPDGMTLDDAGEALQSAGYFRERPTTAQVMDAIEAGYRGRPVYRADDLGDLEAFESAQAMRYDVEAAAQEGAPLAERVGRPVGPEDLDAMEPPALAYEEVAALSGRVAGFNLSRMANGKDIAQSIRAIDEAFGIRAGAAGRRSWAESQALADEAGVSIDDILQSNSGQPLSDAEAIAYRAVLAKAHGEMMAIARRIANGRGSDVDRALLEQAAMTVAAVQHKVTRRRAELARAMSVLRKTADPSTLQGPVLRRVIEAHGGPGKSDDLARALVDAEAAGLPPGAMNRLAAEATEPGLRDMGVELFYASILSAPTTHAINMAGNAGALALSVPEFGLAAMIGGARNIFSRTSDRVSMAEVAAYAGGLVRGVKRGLKLVPRVFRTGDDVDFATKVETRVNVAIPGRAGYVIRTPLRALAAEDALFKAMTRTGAQARLAWRAARLEGLEGQALARRADELFSNPTEEMIEEAGEFARYMSFQNTPGVFGNAILSATNKVPELKYKIPFVRTLGNLVKFAAARSPVALLMPSVWRDLRAGGEKMDLALSRMTIGSVIGWLAMEAAANGVITGGGPLDFRERQRLEETGWQPYSINLGNRYISYRRLDPLATVVSIAADFATYQEHMTPGEQERSALILSQLISRNLQDSFWLGSVSDLLDFFENPGREVPATLGQVGGALLVPNVIAQPLASYDPVQRDQRPQTSPEDAESYLLYAWETIRNRVMARIPGLRDNLPARETALGDPVRYDGRWGWDIVSPFQQRLVNQDPVTQELHRNNFRVGEPRRETEGVRHTPEQQRALRELSGQYIREGMSTAMRSPAWQRMAAQDRQEWFDDIKREARQRARDELRLHPGMGPAPTASGGSLPPGFVIEGREPAPQMNVDAPAEGLPPGFVLEN